MRTAMTRRLGVVGYPIRHSISPAMHQAALDELGIDARYERWEVAPADLAGWVASLRDPAVLGANVTVPHKQAVMPFLDELAPAARAIGAVNTIVSLEGRLRGDNTDAAGFARALRDVATGVTPRRAVLLGAGGAARACVHALLERRNDVLVANRSAERLDALLRSIEVEGRRPRSAPWPRAGERIAAGAVVNTTPLGMRGEDPLDGVGLPPLVVDIVPTAEPTALVKRAQATENVAVVDGLSMLLHQAARSFELWTGAPAPLAAMRAALPRPA